jgi:hypothetical protein
MILSERHLRHFLGLSLAALGLVSNAAAKPRIVPLRTSATFSSQSPQNGWSVLIKSTHGSTLYVLSLEPDFDAAHHVVSLELVLRHADDKADAPNLFDPTGKHGLQAYDFAANDLAGGIQKSAFGEKRKVSLKSLRLIIQVAVSKATVSPISGAGNQIEALELQIEADNVDH